MLPVGDIALEVGFPGIIDDINCLNLWRRQCVGASAAQMIVLAPKIVEDEVLTPGIGQNVVFHPH
ncbi:hypothetical protein D3C76_1882990 [compost metagenome]